MNLMGREDEFERLISTYRLEDVRDAILRFARTSTRLLPRLDETDSGRSKFGGVPDVPETFEWPLAQDGLPLAFLCQIDLEDLRGTCAGKELPDTGTLSFFFGSGNPVADEAWGFKPSDGDRWKVLWFNQDTKLLPAKVPDQIHEDRLYASFGVTFEDKITFADWRIMQEDGVFMSQDMRERYVDAFFNWDYHYPNHRLLGNPQLIQWDWRPQCQLVTHGVYCGNSEGFESEEANAILAQRENWRLLLQLDSDEIGVGYWWALGGMLYFAIKQEDLEHHRFEGVWTTLQTD